MKLYRMTLTLESSFGTPLVGDTLFGQVCWGIRHRFAESKLTELLATYTATTSGDGFTPYMTRQTWYGNAKIQLDIYVLLDENKFTAEQLKLVLQDIGTFGYGRDASIGLGKFSVTEMATLSEWTRSEFSNAFITLANYCPMNNDFVAEKSFYQLTTRFGRHGDAYALKGQPFKKPIILAKAGGIANA